MVLTKSEAELYVRLTLKQMKVSGVTVTFLNLLDNDPHTMGLFEWETETIYLKEECLDSFHLFEYIFKHELAHYFDYKERGTLFTESGRANFHGSNFNKWCRKLKIPTGRFVPKRLLVC